MTAHRVLAIFVCALVVAASSTAVHAQALDDAVVLPKGDLVVANIYVHDSWDHYWEGTLKRTNGNIGTLTVRANVLGAAYGLSDAVTVMAGAPYVWTRASQGVLHSMQGMQDITFAMKVRAINRPMSPVGAFRLVGVMGGGIPLSDYTPDFQPLSIGMGARRLLGRLTANVEPASGWFTNGSAGYALRGGVTLDRPYYFTEDRLVFSDSVVMPNVFDYSVTTGVARRRYMGAFGLSQTYTLGGGDIRRQDMPFVSNRMNFTTLSAMVQAPVPRLPDLAVQFGYRYTVHGRNVGQATTLSGGVVYRLSSVGEDSQ